MSVYIGDVQTFSGVIADKPQVLKIGEETMEVFSAWEDYKYAPEFRKEALIAEIADVIQAACNLLAAIGVDDMRQPMQACYVRNRERGREYSSSGDSMDEQQDSIRTRPISNGTCPIDEPQSADANDSREKLDSDLRGTLLLLVDNVAKTAYDQTFDKHLKVDAWWNAFVRLLDRQAAITAIEVARERYDIERDLITARDELQEALNAATGKWAKADARCSELQAALDQQRATTANARDMWQKADARCSELKAENDGLKARIESLRSKLSKMLDAASSIQHIGDLP